MSDIPLLGAEGPSERPQPPRRQLLLVEKIWPCSDAHARVKRWHLARIDRHTDPMARADAAARYLRAVLARMAPEDAVPFADEYIDNVLDLIDTVEEPDPDQDEDDQW